MELGVDRAPLNAEWFIDHKPDGYAFAGERKQLTEAEASVKRLAA